MTQLIIIKTANAEKIRLFLDQEKQNYKVFNQTQRKKDFHLLSNSRHALGQSYLPLRQEIAATVVLAKMDTNKL